MRGWLAFVLAGCVAPPLDTGEAPVPPWRIDDDGDGNMADVDCDDADAGIHPGAPERCDGLDQDCDDLVDEDALDAPAWYPDGDGDGAGDAAAPLRACDPPPGALETGEDCDDADAAVRPGAPERCNGEDDDCDGAIDEDTPADSPTWYADLDGDGYGDPGAARVACPAPEGFVADASDCDDADAARSPAAAERCDGVDGDCDGVVDEDPLDGEWAYHDGDGDGWGDPVTGGSFCAERRPPGAVDRGEDCDDTRADIAPDAGEVCDGLDQDCDGVADEDAADALAWLLDGDGDGYGAGAALYACAAPAGRVASGGDCDDAAADRHPGAAEACDAVDTDCDGLSADDESLDALAWYADADADGHGDPAAVVPACDAPAGFVADPDDCDDADPAAFPGAEERCDGVDTDCDGTLDEDDARDAPAWYGDGDGDGHGDPGAARTACAAPPGTVARGDDCDDADPTRSPSASESCDGRDDDCDGVTDEDDAVDALVWYADADADGAGDPGATTAACAAPAGFVARADDCDDGNPLARPGRPEVCNDGADNDCDGSDDGCVRTGLLALADVAHARVRGAGYDEQVGAAGADLGDVDGDGLSDLLVGVPGFDEAWLFLGPPSGDLGVGDVSAAFVGGGGGDWGSALAAAGDFDGDGPDDAVLGGPAGGGACVVLLGPWTSDRAPADAALVLVPEGAADALGSAVVGVGDLDGDGLDDLAIGAPGADGGAMDGGAAYLVYGGSAGSLDLAAPEGVFYGTTASTRAGYALAGPGDLDGDGLDDLVVGVPSDRTAALLGGAAYLVRGPATGTHAPATADAAWFGGGVADFAGSSVAAAGDTDADGALELLVGAPYADDGAADAGAAYLVRGPWAGTHLLSAADALLAGSDRGEQAGYRVAGVGDFDRDGFDDLAVGAWRDDEAGADAGIVYLLLGPGPWAGDLAAADLRLFGTTGATAGAALSGGAPGGRDLTGDGVPDLLVGAPRDASGGAAGGALLVVPGRGL